MVQNKKMYLFGAIFMWKKHHKRAKRFESSFIWGAN